MKSFSVICDACGIVNHMARTHCLVCGQPLPTASNRAATPSTALFSSQKLLKQQYRILQLIGKGGMGTVYAGEDTRLGNRLVAIKEMSQSGISRSEKLDAARNFKNEAHLLAGLQHPNLPGIYDHFEENQHWYLVMSFVKGQTLTDYLATKNGKLPVEEVLEIGIVLCNVLNYLHTQQPPIVFRDLKPSNIMRTMDGHIYLIDFGIARFFKPGQAKDTATYGSFGYAPPEQYGKTQTTPRSDIYSLGATLYQLLSGYEPAKTPFHLPPLQPLAPSAPAHLVTLITQMLAFEEQKRPQNVEVVKAELQTVSSSLNSTLPLHPPAKRRGKNLLTIFAAITFALILIASILLVVKANIPTQNGVRVNTPVTSITATNRPVTETPTKTPTEVLATFCHALDLHYPDFQTAYSQLSSTYQAENSFQDFTQRFQGTNQCTTASYPDTNHRAEINLAMPCPPPPQGGPPPQGSPPPQGGGPPYRINLIDLTLINDGNNGWKIDTLSIASYGTCPGPNN